MQSGGYGRLKLYANNSLIPTIKRCNACTLLGTAHYIAAYNPQQNNNKIKQKHFELSVEWLEKAWKCYDNQEVSSYLKLTIVNVYCRFAEYLERINAQPEQVIVYWCKAADFRNAHAICRFVSYFLNNDMRVEFGDINIRNMLEYVLQKSCDDNSKAEATYLLGLYYYKKGISKRAYKYLHQAGKFDLDLTEKQNVNAMLQSLKTGTSLIWVKPQVGEKSSVSAVTKIVNQVLKDAVSQLSREGETTYMNLSGTAGLSDELLQDVVKVTQVDDQKSSSYIQAMDCLFAQDIDGLEKLAIEQDNVHACATLATMYLYGHHTEQDYGIACYYMLHCLETAQGITQDGLFWSPKILEDFVMWMKKLEEDIDAGNENAIVLFELLKKLKDNSNLDKDKLQCVVEKIEQRQRVFDWK
jgi:TPR repeat protein